jgi:hypothetical protein
VILVEIAFDFLDQRLLITTSDGQQRVVELGRRPACADFYRDVFGALHAVGVDVEIHADPSTSATAPRSPRTRSTTATTPTRSPASGTSSPEPSTP